MKTPVSAAAVTTPETLSPAQITAAINAVRGFELPDTVQPFIATMVRESQYDHAVSVPIGITALSPP